MKFTKEEAFESLKGILTNNGKKTLRMSEKSILKQIETLMPLVANEEMELNDFVSKVKDTFSVMNSNAEKDNSDFVKQWEKEHPVTEPSKSEKSDDTGEQDAISKMMKRIEELEARDAARQKEKEMAQKKSNLLKAMKEKGIKDEQWAKDFISEVNLSDDFDIDSKAESYLKLYNKSQAGVTTGATPYMSSSNGGDPNKKDPLAEARKFIEQRNKERESIKNQE